jgi:hypothetical protein
MLEAVVKEVASALFPRSHLAPNAHPDRIVKPHGWLHAAII